MKGNWILLILVTVLMGLVAFGGYDSVIQQAGQRSGSDLLETEQGNTEDTSGDSIEPETSVKDDAEEIAALPEVGKKAPDFTLTTIDGQEVSLSDFRGQKVLLNFWASWCPPCQEEMPDIQRYYSEHGDEMTVLAVNIMLRETEKTIRDFLTDGDYTFTVLLDKDQEVARIYRANYIPVSYFIDGEGIISYHKVGPLTDVEIKTEMNKMR